MAADDEVLNKQKRSRVIAMTADELDQYFAEERTVRVGTVSKDGTPHVTALWFVWDGEAMWFHSITKSRRWVDFQRRPRISALVDSGTGYNELRGAEVMGEVETLEHGTDQVAAAEKLWADKYHNGTFTSDKFHSWARLVPTKIVSWDFRKLPADRKRP